MSSSSNTSATASEGISEQRLRAITGRYSRLRVAVVGDYCLDRYLEIDPARQERSLETGLAVHNVVRVRSQPGGAGTILNNLAALGIGKLHPVGFCGEDGEGYELRRALDALRGMDRGSFVQTDTRRTFTYAKPLVMHAGRPPQELSRLDSKNWTPTPAALENQLMRAVARLAPELDALILLDQVDRPNTGVVTQRLLERVSRLARKHPRLLILADSRRGLRGFPAVTLKMNRAELGALTGQRPPAKLELVRKLALKLAREKGRAVFVTLAEQGMVGADPGGYVHHVPAFPVTGPIDIVGAGDAVTANLAAALAAGATLLEALWLASAAASIVIHQLGTTGTADVRRIRKTMCGVAGSGERGQVALA